MDFLKDWWTYHSCYEIPRNYAFWSGLGTLGAVVNRKVFYLHGRIEFHGNLYVGLIGPQGSSKSTCCDFACAYFREACPDANIGPSRSSPESLVKIMSEKDFARVFTNERGESVEVRPFAFFINEFKNFVGRSPFDMLTWLTDVYDRKFYDASTIVRGLEPIVNPSVNLIMCETPDWMIRNLKADVISGGFSRRIIYAYETGKVEAKPHIVLTKPDELMTTVDVQLREDALRAEERFKRRLVEVRSVKGEYKWTADGSNIYEKWYHDNARREASEPNKVMAGYLGSKNVQLYKVMMLLDVSSDKPMLVFNADMVDMGLALLDAVEGNMPKLSAAAGRNELMGPQQRILELVQQGWSGGAGWIPEKELAKGIETEVQPLERMSILRHLEDTGQLIKREFDIVNSAGVSVRRMMYLLPWKYEELKGQK